MQQIKINKNWWVGEKKKVYKDFIKNFRIFKDTALP